MDGLSLIIGAAAGVVAGGVAGFLVRKSVAEKKIGSAEAQARHILEDAIKGAESAKKRIHNCGKRRDISA